MRSRVSISLPPEILKKVKIAAVKEHRSLSSMVGILVLRGINEKEKKGDRQKAVTADRH